MWGYRLWMWSLPLDSCSTPTVKPSQYGVMVHYADAMGHNFWRELTRHAAFAVAADVELDAADYEAQAKLHGPFLPSQQRAREHYPAMIAVLRKLAADLRAAVEEFDQATVGPAGSRRRAVAEVVRDRGG